MNKPGRVPRICGILTALLLSDVALAQTGWASADPLQVAKANKVIDEVTAWLKDRGIDVGQSSSLVAQGSRFKIYQTLSDKTVELDKALKNYEAAPDISMSVRLDKAIRDVRNCRSEADKLKPVADTVEEASQELDEVTALLDDIKAGKSSDVKIYEDLKIGIADLKQKRDDCKTLLETSDTAPDATQVTGQLKLVRDKKAQAKQVAKVLAEAEKVKSDAHDLLTAHDPAGSASMVQPHQTLLAEISALDNELVVYKSSLKTSDDPPSAVKLNGFFQSVRDNCRQFLNKKTEADKVATVLKKAQESLDKVQAVLDKKPRNAADIKDKKKALEDNIVSYQADASDANADKLNAAKAELDNALDTHIEKQSVLCKAFKCLWRHKGYGLVGAVFTAVSWAGGSRWPIPQLKPNEPTIESSSSSSLDPTDRNKDGSRGLLWPIVAGVLLVMAIIIGIGAFFYYREQSNKSGGSSSEKGSNKAAASSSTGATGTSNASAASSPTKVSGTGASTGGSTGTPSSGVKPKGAN